MRSIAARPSLRALPNLDTIAAEPDPVQRAVQLGNLARSVGTLPPAYAQLRVSSLLEALRNRRVREVAAMVGVSPSRISQLTSRSRLAVAA
jgi:DNA-directed RNA polymerase specialized sigma subunit